MSIGACVGVVERNMLGHVFVRCHCRLGMSGRRVQLWVVYEVPHSSNYRQYGKYSREAERLGSGDEYGVDQASDDGSQLQNDNPKRLFAFGKIVVNGAVHKAAEMEAEANEGDCGDGCDSYRGGRRVGHLTILIR